MTKKDYELIAQAIRDNTEWVRYEDKWGETVTERKIHPTEIMAELSIAFEKENPKFNKFRFFEACKKPYPKAWEK